MIQFNLLPDIKLEFIKSRRLKRIVFLLSVAAASVAVTILVSLYVSINIIQKQHITNLSNDIVKNEKHINNIQDLNKILTVQNQLNSLTALHDQKLITGRIFEFLPVITPAKVTISAFSIDLKSGAVSISGSADNITTVNKFVDTLKFTTFSTDQVKDQKVFSSTVVAGFGGDDKTGTYSISTIMDVSLFDGKVNPKLTVPNIITTRSQTDRPSALFQQTDIKAKP